MDRIVLNAYFGMGHSPGGFRVWWRALTGSDDTLDNAHLMRSPAGSVDACEATPKRTTFRLSIVRQGGVSMTSPTIVWPGQRSPKACFWSWSVAPRHRCGTSRRITILERKKPYVNHYSFRILDRDWGHVTIKISGHPPFPAQVILNGHEYVACQARKAGIRFIKDGNCFTAIGNTSGLAKIAETLSEQRTVGRLRQVCERWIYRSCLCFALDFDEQQRSGFRYHFSNYQMKYSRNLIFEVGGHMEQVFQALIDRSRALLDLKTIKTIFGDKGRPKYRPRNMRTAEWEVAVERPTYDLTVFKLHCGKLTLKIYTKGERVPRIEAVAHNIREFHCGRLLGNFPEIVGRLRGMLEQFMEALAASINALSATRCSSVFRCRRASGSPWSGVLI